MFYPVESLKRGGRFYLCWVADSYPLRFSAITHKDLWSQDIRKLCDNLMEVVTNESGRPTNRFSLRLSSQLMRGLVRLYDKKVTVFLENMCMIHANIFKHANKKLLVREVPGRARQTRAHLPRVQEVLPEAPGNALTLGEMLQSSGNMVTNVQDITLKEAAIPDFQLPPNDGFGEEHPEQALQQLLGDRTVEMMLLQADASAAQHSVLELPLDKSAERSHDRSRLLHARDTPQMERISERDVTLFRKSTAEELQPPEEIEKDMSAITDIPPPAPAPAPAPEPAPEPTPEPAPQPESAKHVEPMEVEQEPLKDQPEPPQERQEKQPEIELEELEEGQQAGRKRRARPHLIIDKRTKLGSAFLRARIDNPSVELRCEESGDDIANLRVPWEYLSRRPAHAGGRVRTNMAGALIRVYQRRLLYDRVPYEQREVQTPLPERPHRQTRAALEKIIEEEELIPPVPAPIEQPALIEQPMAETDVTAKVGRDETAPPDVTAEPNVSAAALDVTTPRDVTLAPDVTVACDVTGEPDVIVPRDVTGAPDTRAPQDQRPSAEPMELDIHNLPTQKLLTLKRTSEYEVSAKRPRLSGYLSFKESQQLQKEIPEPVHQEMDKENMPPEQAPPQHLSQRDVSTLLQEAGLADRHPPLEEVALQTVAPQVATGTRRRQTSENSETQLGSLDRTKVSLGDSEKTTESQRFIRHEWGVEGTMTKILNGVKAGLRPLTVESLLEKGPFINGHKAVIAARCFTSILKLKQHSFIKVVKNPDTLEIKDIILGPVFDDLMT